MAGTINNNTTWNEFKSILAGGGQITFVSGTNLTYNPNTHAQVDIGANAVINGNGATITIQCSGNAYTNSEGQWAIYWVGAGCTINDLNLKGRQGFWIRGANITFNRCKVDQSSDQSEVYNALDGMYACYLINYSAANNVKFNDCEALYADHMGYAVWNGTFDIHNLEWNRCKAMHCGSGREHDETGIDGRNPWGRGWDFLEDFGVVRFTATDCCAYDCLQSGFYNEGDYDGRNSHIVGKLIRCHSENNGMRIVQAAKENRNLIGNIPWPNGVKSSSPDVYGDGYYLTGGYGDGVQLIDCTSKNNIVGLTLDRVTVSNFQDEGSYIGMQCTGSGITNGTFVKTKYHVLAWWNGFNGGSIRIIDPPTGRAPVLSSWFAISGQRNIHPGSYDKIFVNHDNIVSTKYSNGGYLLFRNFANERWNGYSGNTPSGGLSILVNSSEYDTPSKCVKTHKGGSGNTNNITVSYNSSLTYTAKSGCGAGGPIITPTCIPGEINCANKKICVKVNDTTIWDDIDPSSLNYLQRCPDADCPQGSTRVICIDQKEYRCRDGKKVATGKTCVGNKLSPYTSTLPVLQKGTRTQIYARDFGLGGSGVAFNDTTATNEGGALYREDGVDSASVDLTNWGAFPTRMTEPDANKIVVSHTTMGEWLKYPVKVIDDGTYVFTMRASTAVDNCAVIVSVDGAAKKIINIPNTGKYETFQYATGNVIVPYISDKAAITIEFVGDINLLWFSAEWLSDDGGLGTPPIENDPGLPITQELTQIPYNNFNVRNEYGYVCKIDGMWYDKGGEGNAYHNEQTGVVDTYRRGMDAVELFDNSVVTSTNEWLEYTVSVSTTADYYFKFNTKNSDPNAKITVTTVDAYGHTIQTLFTANIPVSASEFIDTVVKTDTASKFRLLASEYLTLRLTFTGEFLFKSMSIMSSDTVENKIVSQSAISPMPDIKTLPFTIEAYQFDTGGQGISYMDRTEERFSRKAVRDSDVDIITVARDNSTETLITGTMKGEWVQYTIKNDNGANYVNLNLEIECSTTDSLSRMYIVFINEYLANTFNANNDYSNTYTVKPPLVNSFTNVQKMTVPIKVYKGMNIMRIYFDDNITLGSMTFKP